MNKTEVILASASPRRQELLKYIFDEFKIIPSDADETVGDEIPVDFRPELIASRKAVSVAADYPNSLVIGCDTAVIVDNIMLGKPADKADAVHMLKLLSGRKHKVITGCCLCLEGKEKKFSVITEVEFYPLCDSEIEKYIATDDWRDKAGAYGIQGAANLFVRGISGDYNNVVGLPCAELNRQIKEFLGE
ncbi:MAG: septum formation protein Maf [Ruminococcus sp.]|nr:septum formation protein Maf [Ruminococcus sp.]